MRKLEVTLMDSCSCTKSWSTREEALEWAEEGVIAQTVGYFVSESKDWLTIAASYHEDQYGGLWNIPKGCIVRRRRLK